MSVHNMNAPFSITLAMLLQSADLPHPKQALEN